MNLYLLAPEISLCALALVVILLDLFIGRKWILGVVSVVGLIVAGGLAVALWREAQESSP